MKFPVEQYGIHCRECGEDIYSNSRHDFVTCSCGAWYIDGGFDYMRVGGSGEHQVVQRTLIERPPHYFRDEK